MFRGRLFILNEVKLWSRFKKSLDLQISLLVGAFLVNLKCFIEIVHDKWCLDESVGQTENGLE